MADKDPFTLHFERELPLTLQSQLNHSKPYKRKLELDWPAAKRIQYFGLPQSEPESGHLETEAKSNSADTNTNVLGLANPKKFVQLPLPPPKEFPLSDNVDSKSSSVDSDVDATNDLYFLKQQLLTTIPLANQNSIDKASCKDIVTPLQKEILLLTSQYQDLYFTPRTYENEEEVRMAYCIHAINHALKTKTRIINHNSKLAERPDLTEIPDEFRDQGFVRPKVLFLAPFKESALRIVKTLVSLMFSEEKGNVENKKRFEEDFSGETLFMPKTNPKPEDYVATFAGNVEDNFKIGLAIAKKSLRLYTDFYNSDIIIASPLGLRLIIGAEGEKERDYDFLSSIEVTVIDQADIFLMQNWDHLLHVIKHINLQPIKTHDTNFGRIRPWALDNLSRHYSQTLIFSAVPCPEHLSLFSRYCKNYAGLNKVIQSSIPGIIGQITVQLPQVFQRFDSESLEKVNEDRFKYFVESILPNFKEKLMSHTLIFVSSYFDYVRIRNYFKKEDVSFVQICEYTKDKKIARARDYFFHGKNHFMLYTERAHFFRRFRLKGIGHIIFYQLPQYPNFYVELCNLMQEEYQIRRVKQRKNCSVNVVYSKYDYTRLSSLVGTERANLMVSSEKKTHAFVSGGL